VLQHKALLIQNAKIYNKVNISYTEPKKNMGISQMPKEHQVVVFSRQGAQTI
jgi:hypothetical protein